MGGKSSKNAPNENTGNVYLEIGINGESQGKVVIGLRDDVVPKTCKNFRQLCTGENGYGFKGSKFHRIIPGFMCQARVQIIEKSIIWTPYNFENQLNSESRWRF